MTPPELALDIKGVPCLQNQYWKRPTPLKPQGDPTVDPVYAAVGRALSQWEKLEQRLATLFIVVTRASDSSNNAVRRAYGAIENGTLRRKAIIAAAEVHFGASWQPHVEEAYNKLIDAVSRASKLRDDIAHGIVQHFKFNNIDYGAFLFPPYYNTGRTTPYLTNDDGPPDFGWSDFCFTSEDILGIERRFGELKQIIAHQFVILSSPRENGSIPLVEALTRSGDP